MASKSSEDTPSSLPPAPEHGVLARVLHWVRLAPRMPFVWAMRIYRMTISHLYGDVCKYYPSCSKYALDAYEVKGSVRGTALTVWRLLRCNPFSQGGVDYVQDSFLHRRSLEMNSPTNGTIGRDADND